MSTSHETGRPARDIEVGNEEPIAGAGRKRAPDRREVSLRWLSGTALTGLTSTLLMGAALFAALDGRELLATPAEVATTAELDPLGSRGLAEKGPRIVKTPTVRPEPADRRRMSVSTVTRVGDADVIRTKPFEQVRIDLAANHQTDQSYPAFDPLNIFSEGEAEKVAEDEKESVLYGASVETEVSLRVADFDFDRDVSGAALSLSDGEAEEIVRSTAALLSDGTTQVAALHYVDPLRFGADGGLASVPLAASARIVPQNMSIAPRDARNGSQPVFEEDILEYESSGGIAARLEETGYGRAGSMAKAIATLLKKDTLDSGDAIRLGLEGRGDDASIVRASVYGKNRHKLTVALNDRMQYVPAPEPVDSGIMAARQGGEAQAVAARDLPSAYNAIYRGVLSYDLPQAMAEQIVRMVAADVDFRRPIGVDDSLELFFSLPEEGLEGDDDSHELLFVEASFGDTDRTFYRFRTPDGMIDYYDEEGRSARQFLLRKPVPNGQFRSGYGMRKHPVLGYSRMHWGVDWAAPRGTPIIAPGNGTVEKAGWASGYGKQTIIRHANGYETSYNHQSKFAKGVAPGAKVRQGQVIGYIGTTGLSTGPHLHYEMRVNGNRVDPLRVRLPQGRVLEGEELAAFERERDRINALLGKEPEATVVAQAGD